MRRDASFMNALTGDIVPELWIQNGLSPVCPLMIPDYRDTRQEMARGGLATGRWSFPVSPQEP